MVVVVAPPARRVAHLAPDTAGATEGRPRGSAGSVLVHLVNKNWKGEWGLGRQNRGSLPSSSILLIVEILNQLLVQSLCKNLWIRLLLHKVLAQGSHQVLCFWGAVLGGVRTFSDQDFWGGV